MSKREGQDSPAAPASGSDSEPDALTSGDIFGEILDEVGGERLEPSEEAPVRSGRGPIKVQVSEPDPAARGAARVAPGGRKAVKELRPEDVATLLDVFSAAADDAFALEPPLTADDAVADEAVVEEAVVEEAAVDEPVTDEPVADEPTFEESAIEEAIAGQPVLEDLVAEDPVVEDPLVEDARVEEPVAAAVIEEEPLVEEPLAAEVMEDAPAIEPDWGAPEPEPAATPDDEPVAAESVEPGALPLEIEAGEYEPALVLDAHEEPARLILDAAEAEAVFEPEPEPDLMAEIAEEAAVELALEVDAEPLSADHTEVEPAPIGGKSEQPLEPLPPPPPSPRDPLDRGTDEGLRDLLNLMRVSKARAHQMEAGPNRFRAAAPSVPEAEPPVDLAALAEQAFDEGAAAVGTGDRPVRAVPKLTAAIHYGPYRLLQRIAVGGMAEVFRGKRAGVEGFEKVVAVKRILPHLSDNKEFVDMFIDEAKMVGGLTHPNIVQIFDLGRIDKTYFIAMEYVHGRDLRTILRRAREKGLRVPLDLAVLIGSRVCSALEFAHRKKDERGQAMLIVHRDVSPQNILISFEGEVKLTDFGIAKAATKATVTDAGALRGKLLYMSPEQAWGKPMDRRSDVFSLGIVLYEMATGQKPFLGNSEMSILEMVRDCQVVPPSEANPRIPEKLERVLLKALDRDPDGRYQDAAEMLRDLERALPERPAPTGVDLTRFLEVLFDEDERSEKADDGPASSLHHPGAPAEVHVEFDSVLPDAVPTAEPEPEVEVAVEPLAPAAPARDPMSIQKLLKRFGIK